MRVLTLRGLMIAMLALVVSNGVAFAGPREDAQAAYDRGDYATALQLFVTLARKGNAAAQTQIGWMYEWGFGVSKDSNEAIKWYRLAAAQGNLEAQRLLGFVYGTGRGVPKDDKEALKWFQLAAAQGDATAQNKLGELYTKGGDVPRDYGEAVKWFRLAAEQGHEDAQNNLGLMYQRGQGVPQDYILSFMWLIIGETNLAAVAPTYSARPTSAQFALAQKLAKQCTVSNYKQCGEPQGAQSIVPAAATRWADPDALKAFVGKYASDQINGVTLVEVPEVRSRVQFLLGANVPNLMSQWATSTPFEEQVGWLVAAGCRPHLCHDNQWVIAINFSNYYMFICFAEEKNRLVKYGATGKTLIELTPSINAPPCPDKESALPVFQRLFFAPIQSAEPRPIGPMARTVPGSTQDHAPSQVGVSLKKEGGTFVVPVLINGAITLDFTVDSGAADVSVPADVFSTLARTGTIRDSDIIGEETYVLADGSKSQSVTFTIRSLKVGDRIVENVRGSVAPSRGSLLLGQSFLERFKSWSVDNTKHVLLLEPQ